MQKNIKFTIFTPTYNRGNIITKLFNSLCKQTFSSFEWIIIDNGDKTIERLVSLFQENANFTIVYEKNSLPGINSAYNKAAKLAKGALFFKVDDDDYLSPDALSFLDKVERSLPKNKKFAGIAGLRAYPNGDIIGGNVQFKTEFVDATNFQRDYFGLNGDKAECYYLSVLKKYLPFPEFENENYTDESILYNQIANDNYLIRWYNKCIYYTEYRDDGTTKNLLEKLKSNPKTYTFIVNQRLKFESIKPIDKLKLLCRYIEVYRSLDGKWKSIFDKIDYHKSIVLICWLISYITELIPRKKLG